MYLANKSIGLAEKQTIILFLLITRNHVYIQLNFDISTTDISNTFNMLKFLSTNHLFLSILPLIFQILRYLSVFKQSHLIRVNKVWL